MKRRLFPLLLLLACLARGAPGWGANATLFVAPAADGGDNDNNCTSKLTPCLDLSATNGAFSKISGAGNQIRIKAGVTHRWLAQFQTPTAGTAASKNVLTGWDFDTDVPAEARLTQTSLRTGWTSCSGGSGGCTAVPSGLRSQVWFTSHANNPHATVLQDADKNGQTHLGFTCQYVADDPSTHHLWDTCYNPMRAHWGNINGTCAGCTLSNGSCDPCRQTCPDHLDQDHEYCWDDGEDRLYLFSTSDPDDRFVFPGVEAVNVGNIGFLRIRHSHWTVQHLKVIGAATRPVRMAEETAGAATTIAGVTFQNLEIGFNWRKSPLCTGAGSSTDCQTLNAESGSALLAIDTDVSGDVITDVLIQDVWLHDGGRELLTYLGPGNLTNITATRVRGNNAFAHGFHNAGHPGGSVAGPTPRAGLVYNALNIHDTCGGVGTGSGGLAQTAFNSTYNTPYFHDGLKEDTDARIPLAGDCGESEMSGIHHSASGTVTINGGVFTRNRHGITNARASGVLDLDGVTITENQESGLRNTVNGGTINYDRTIVRNNGTDAAASSTRFQVGCTGCTGSTFTGGNTAATQNNVSNRNQTVLFRNSGANQTMTQWRAAANTEDEASTTTTPGFVNAAGGDFNLGTSSTVDNLAAVTAQPLCGAGRELGGLELPEVLPSTFRLLDSNTIEFQVCTTGSPVVPVCSLLTPVAASTTRTASNCSVMGDTTVRLDFSGAGATPGTVVTLAGATGAIETAPLVGGTGGLPGRIQAFGPITVENTIVTPSPTTCTVADNARDKATLCFAGGVSPMLPANNCTGIDMAFDAAFTQPWTQEAGGCDRVGTTDCFLIDNTTDAVAGQTPFIRYQTTGNITDSSAPTPIEPTAFTMPCTNGIIADVSVIHVAKTGSDAVACADADFATPADAKLTVAAGIACMTAADTLILHAGTYVEAITDTVLNGISWTTPTTVQAATGEAVMVQPSGATSALTVLGTDNAPAFILFKDLVFDGTNSTLSVVRIASGAHTVRIQGGKIQNGAAVGLALAKVGDGPTTTAVEVTGTEITNNATVGVNVTSSGNTFTSLNVHDNGTIGINLDSDSLNVNDNTVSKTRVNANGSDGIVIDSGSGNRVVNSLIHNNGGDGIQIDSSSTTALIENTTVALNAGTGVLNAGATSTIRNTIAFQNTVAQMTDSGSGTTLTTNLTTDPSWENAGSGDFDLLNGSAAVNVGTTLAGVPDDFAGVLRPVGVAYDIGALERDVPDTTAPARTNLFPVAQVFAAGTTSVPIGLTTNEVATCKWGTAASQAFADKPNTFTGTGTTSHTSTVAGLTDGSSQTIRVRCQDVSLNTNASDVNITFSVAFAAPTVTQCFTPDGEANIVYCDTNDGGNGPLIPASNCATAGWTCEKNAGTGRTETDCDIDASSRIKITLGDSLVSGDTATCAYGQASGDITNAGGTQELTAGTFMVDNHVDAPTPPTDGVLTQTTVRIGRPGCGTNPFSSACTIVDGIQDAVARVPAGSVHQIHAGFTCTTNDCPTAAHVFQACDSTNCTSSNPGDAAWYTITDDCTGRLACYGDDGSVGSLADTVSSLSGCTRAAGVVYKKGTGAVFVPVTLTAGQCATYIGVVRLSPAVTAGQFTDVRLVKDGGTVFTTYSVLARLHAVISSATR